MNDTSNKNSSKMVIIAILLAALVASGYYFLSGKSEYGTETPTPASTEQSNAPTNSEEAVPTPEPTPEQAPVVVETKTLNLPSASAPQIPVANTTSSPEVEKMMGVRKLGNDDAPIKIVEYSSLTCGHCSAFHKNDFSKIKTDYIDTGKVQFIFKEFPLNKPAVDASKLLRCMPEDKFVAFQTLLFEEQEKWAYSPEYLAPLKQNAKLAGLSEEQVESCLNNKELENRIIGDMKAGSEKFKIESTPTFIVNDGVKTIVGHQPITVFEETFKSILDGAASNTADVEENKE